MYYNAEVAQSVEQWTENPRVPSSILGLGTTIYLSVLGTWLTMSSPFFLWVLRPLGDLAARLLQGQGTTIGTVLLAGVR